MVEHVQAVRERVGRNVKRLRLRLEWSQDQLAERVGNTGKHIGQIERGEVNVTLDYLSKIAEVASVDVAEVFFNDATSPGVATADSIAIFISQEELDAIDRARRLLGRAEEMSRRVAPESVDSSDRHGSSD